MENVGERIGAESAALKGRDGEERYIPKYRFDCVNVSLKEHKRELAALKQKYVQLLSECGAAEENARIIAEKDRLIKAYARLVACLIGRES